ncbi:MAG: sugar ABC transporter ATP-binding protein [Lacisediminihabitans sp.]
MSKRFLGTVALDGVDFDVRAGEVHALLGQNGAGKSTLIKILAGVYEPDAGSIIVGGRVLRPPHGPSPIAFIHQDLGLVAGMTVAENVALVAGYPRRNGLVSWGAVRRRAAEALRMLQIDVDPDADVATLTAAQRSLVAIARALTLDAGLLVLDEPTAALPETDVEKLFAALNQLRLSGVGLIYVTHRLDEVFRIADRVTVLRDGKRVATSAVTDSNQAELVRWIVGHELDAPLARVQVNENEVLTLRDVSVGHGIGPVSLRLHSGEVLGLVGLTGAGHNEIGRAVFGAERLSHGEMLLDGQPLRPRSPAEAVSRRIGFVSGSRVEESTAANLTVQENLFINPVSLGRSLLGMARRSAESARAREVLDRFDVRPRDPDRLIGSLSGGNQQKVVVARWLEVGSRLLILEEPTAGVDVGSKADIYRLLAQVPATGGGVLIISSDFEEVVAICDRALVFNRGRVIADVPRGDLSVARLTGLSAGSALVETPTENSSAARSSSKEALRG